MTSTPPVVSAADSHLRPPIPNPLRVPSPLHRVANAVPSRTTSPSPVPTTIDDKATASYIRRTLCAHHALSSSIGPPKSIHELLPPLTSSNTVDLQLYAIIAVLLKEFVISWYGKITPDHLFVEEIVQTIAHVTRGLEERMRSVDWTGVVYDEIPMLMDRHIEGEWTVRIL